MTNFALFPPEASKIAPQMDALYFFMVLVSLIGLTIVILLVDQLLDSVQQEAASGGGADRRLDAAGGDLDDHSAGPFPGDVCVGRADLLPRVHAAGQCDEHLRGGQAMDVEGGASGRAARDQFAACADGPARCS